MTRALRLALATSSSGPELSPASLAILAGLNVEGWRVQHFASRARPMADRLVGMASGLPGRHLDAWLMGAETCVDLFQLGSLRADLAIVEGTLDDPLAAIDPAYGEGPGLLAPIAEALNLPRVAVVALGGPEAIHLPPLPFGVEAIIIDDLPDAESFPYARRALEFLTRVPVIGAVERLSGARTALRSSDCQRSSCALAALGSSFLKFADLNAIRALGGSRPGGSRRAVPVAGHHRFRVAYAHDEVFGAYFLDSLETLEALGAELVEFSPLRDESLPQASDLVMIGCGIPECYAEELSSNLSMIADLRTHVCRGRRLYAEGGGMAYLGQSILSNGRAVPMAGVLPFDAEPQPGSARLTPVQRTFIQGGWLGAKGTEVRGYRSGRWRLKPASAPEDCPARSGPLTATGDMYFRSNAVGSMVHLHLASLPDFVASFATSRPRTLAGRDAV